MADLPTAPFQLSRNNNPSLRASVSYQFVARFVRLCLALATSVWIARYLGPSSMGLLSYSIAIVSIVTTVGGLGINDLAASLISMTPGKDLVGQAIFLQEIFALAAMLVVIPLCFVILPQPASLLVIAGVFAMPFSNFPVYESLLMFSGKSKSLAKLDLISSIIVFTASVGLLISHSPLVLFALLQPFQALVRVALLRHYCSRLHIYNRYMRFSLSDLRCILMRSLPLMLASLAVTLYMRVDQIMLELMTNYSTVGQYSIAVKLSELAFFAPAVLSQAMTPAISKEMLAKENSGEKILVLYRYSWILGIAIAIGIATILPSVTMLMFGEKYRQASSILPWLSPAAFAVCMGTSTSVWLVLKGFESVSLVRTIVGLIINLSLNLVLIPRCGAMGAALATSISYLCATFIVPLLLSDDIRRNAQKSLFPFAH